MKKLKKTKNIYIIIFVLFFVFLMFFLAYQYTKNSTNEALPSPISPVDETIVINDCIYGKFKCFKNDAFVCRSIQEKKSWEKHLLDLLIQYYKPGTHFLDIGANYGSHTIGVANHIRNTGQGGKITSFEIQPKILNIFRENIQMNGLEPFVTICDYGLSNQNETKLFNLPKNYNINSNPGALSLLNKTSDNAYEDVPIQLRRLDDLGLENISLIKIDVEGYELEAFEGGKQTISRDKPVILLEIWPHNLEKYKNWISVNFPFYNLVPVSQDDYILLPKNL